MWSIVQEKFECSNEQTEDIILQTLPFDSLESLLEDVFLEDEDVFEKHEDNFRRLLLERLTIQDDFVSAVDKKDLSKNIDTILKTLKDREEKVIRDRFGFDNGEEKTLEEVGQDLNITRERVRQIESKALKKLCQPSVKRKLEGYL